MPEAPLILVAEDDPDVCAVIVSFLESRGCRAVVACERATGETMLSTSHPALLIADASLRGGGGVELCQRAESLGIATLLISGEPQKGYQSPFLQKPFRLAELEGELRRLVPGFP